MHPENVLLPLTYGAASLLTIGCLCLCAIAVFGAVFSEAAFRARNGRFAIRPAGAWILLALWSGSTGWIAAGYRDGYYAAAAVLSAQQPDPTEAAADTAIIAATNPTIWAVKIIFLLIIGGFLWVGAARARAAAALLLAHSRGHVDPLPARQAASFTANSTPARPPAASAAS